MSAPRRVLVVEIAHEPPICRGSDDRLTRGPVPRPRPPEERARTSRAVPAVPADCMNGSLSARTKGPAAIIKNERVLALCLIRRDSGREIGFERSPGGE